MGDDFVLQFEGISKQFPGVKALEDVSFDLRRGEVHMLVGENGAGKSTLIKILAGAHRHDAGRIVINGQPAEIQNPAQALARGVSVIYQEFNLVPFLSVAQNIFLGREPRHPKIPGLIDHARMNAESRALLESLGVDIDPRTMVHYLGVAQQQMVEVVKALSVNAQIVVMDEPTSALTTREIEQLFAAIRRLTARGVGVIYISHRLEEVFQIGDRVTVLRDGKWIASMNVRDATMDVIIQAMVGRTIDRLFHRDFMTDKGQVALAVRNLHRHGVLQDINMTVRCGEIVGLAGLVGAGRTELARVIFGADPYDAGEVTIFGRTLRGSPVECVAIGVGFLPEDRKREGLALILPLRENVVMASLRRLFPSGIIRRAKERGVVSDFVKSLDIATPSINRMTKFLSGGTQQKVVLAKWLCTQSRFLIFDEPTRGIDVGAKAEIHQLMNELVKQGAAILMISSELPEALNMSDRIYVMHKGRITKELSREEATQEAILRHAMGVTI
ncbi:MAG: sugar ABC transporter ATP-binding protein [candidate division NC10 bacterium]|nr:sugar ABC transporter ATP-binding protein [candidate division NC10 bacterium]